MSESSLRVIVLPSLVSDPYFELDIEQGEIRKALLIKQETETAQRGVYYERGVYLGVVVYQGPVPRKTVRFNPGLSQILSKVFFV